MTKTHRKTIGRRSPLNPPGIVKGSLLGSGPQDFRRLTKQPLLALHWLAAMLFRPTGRRLCESAAGLNEVARSLPPAHLVSAKARGYRMAGYTTALSCVCVTVYNCKRGEM